MNKTKTIHNPQHRKNLNGSRDHNRGRHARPVSPKVTGKAALRAYARGINYHRAITPPSNASAEDGLSLEKLQANGELNDEHLERLIPSVAPGHESLPQRAKRIMKNKTAQVALLSMLGGALGASSTEAIIDAKNPSPGSQAGISRQVEGFTEYAILTYNNITAQGNGYDNNSLEGKTYTVNDPVTIRTSVPSSNGSTVLLELGGSKNVAGYGGMPVPDPQHINYFSENVTMPNGSRETTTYSLINGNWEVMRESVDKQHDIRSITSEHDGVTYTQISNLNQNGSVDVLSNHTGLEYANSNVSSTNALTSLYLQQAFNNSRHPLQSVLPIHVNVV